MLTSLETSTRDALIQTLPLYEMMRMRAATTARKHPNFGFAAQDPQSALRWVNQFTHTNRKLGPEDREVVSPNNDTAFSNAWLDLSKGPVLIDTPAMGERYWSLGLLDAWTNPFAYVGRRTTGNHAQRTLVCGPDWKFDATSHHVSQIIVAPGHDVWVIGRILVNDSAQDLAAVHVLQAQFRMTRLDGSDAATRADTLMDGRSTTIPSSSNYLSIVRFALDRNPVHADEKLLWPLDEPILDRLLPEVFTTLRSQKQTQQLNSGWALQVAVRTHWGADYTTRARVARNFIGALGMDEAMYPSTEVDAEGAALNGANIYELRFPKERQLSIDAFWSLTLYRRSDCLLIANPIHRYSIGDRTSGLQQESDGGLVIRLQASDPGAAHNWLPTPRDESFYVVLRLYQPRAIHTELRYQYPPIQRID